MTDTPCTPVATGANWSCPSGVRRWTGKGSGCGGNWLLWEQAMPVDIDLWPDHERLSDAATSLGGRTSERRLRLLISACARRGWLALSDEARRAVEVNERFADGLASSAELHGAAASAARCWRGRVALVVWPHLADVRGVAPWMEPAFGHLDTLDRLLYWG